MTNSPPPPSLSHAHRPFVVYSSSKYSMQAFSMRVALAAAPPLVIPSSELTTNTTPHTTPKVALLVQPPITMTSPTTDKPTGSIVGAASGLPHQRRRRRSSGSGTSEGSSSGVGVADYTGFGSAGGGGGGDGTKWRTIPGGGLVAGGGKEDGGEGGWGGGVKAVGGRVAGVDIVGWHPAVEPAEADDDETYHDNWRKLRVAELWKDQYLTPGR